MSAEKETSDVPPKCSFEDALSATGSGWYSAALAAGGCCALLAMYVDLFALSVALPAIACDLALSPAQQGLLAALPLLGVVASSYLWGLCADGAGRRRALRAAAAPALLLAAAAPLAPSYASLAALKFLSACFSSAGNAAGVVLVGESTPRRWRDRCMFLMASVTMLAQFIICCFALPIFTMSFRVEISWLLLEYQPWRLLLHVLCLPTIIGVLIVAFLSESPKYLLSKGKHEECLKTLQRMYAYNTGNDAHSYPVKYVYLDEPIVYYNNDSCLKKIWKQTAPLFKPPLLKNSLKLYYILITAYMTSTGYTMWVPSVTNAYFTGGDKAGLTFCEVASQAVSSRNATGGCAGAGGGALRAAAGCSLAGALLAAALAPLSAALGRRRSTLLVFAASALCGLLLFFVTTPLLSIALFFGFLYVAIVLGNINTYLLELNPTHLRGTAACLSVVFARGGGAGAVQALAALLPTHCAPALAVSLALLLCAYSYCGKHAAGMLVAFSLPADTAAAACGDPSLPEITIPERYSTSSVKTKL